MNTFTVSTTLTKSKYKFIKRWLEYVPDYLEDILNKQNEDLSEKEKEELLQIKLDIEMANIISKFECKMKEETDFVELNSEEENLVNKVNKYFNLEKIAVRKISDSDLNMINNILSEYNGFNKAQIYKNIEILKNEFSREYAHVLLKNISIEYQVKQYEDGLSKMKLKQNKRKVCPKKY